MPELDPVEQKFIANATQYLATLAKMTAAAKALADEVDAVAADIDAAFQAIARSADEATDAVTELKTEIDTLTGKEVTIRVDTEGTGGLGAGLGAGLAGAAAGEGAAAAVAADENLKLAAAEGAVAAASESAAPKLIVAAAAADASGAAATRAWRPWFLFGQNWQTALHWIVAGGAELLAVTVPALIAFGAGAFVALQGAVNLGNHMQAVWTAFEAGGPAVGKTMGDFLGLGHAFQAAQDAANPGVYELLGSAINDAKVHAADFANTGLQVVHMLDEFSARITVDFQAMAKSGEFTSLLGAMIPDLQELGQVFGNLGHAVLNFAAAMPGLAEVLLKVADGASRLILAISSLPTGLIMSVMALEEFYRWGGLVLSLMARMAGAGGLMAGFAEGGGFIAKFGSALKALGMQAAAGIMWLGELIGKMAAVTGAGEEAGAAIEGMGAAMGTGIAAMSPLAMAGIAGVVAAVAIGIVAISRIKDATDNWVASTDRAVAAATDLQVLPKISQTLAENQIKLAGAAQKTNTLLKDQGTQTAAVTARFGEMNGETQRAAQDQMDLTTQQKQLIGTAVTVGQNLGLLGAKFHVTATGALALANAAGINLQTPLHGSAVAMQIMYQQVKNLEAGLGAMGAPAGMIGADMEALGVQSQLAGTKVSQVNQAFDQFTGTLTGGMSGLAQFEGALHTMGNDAQASSIGIDGAIRSISKNAQQMGFTLQGMGPKAQQSWQQFSSAVQQGESVLDTMRIGMSEGMVSAKQMNTAIKDVAGSLLPFAAHSKTATAIVSSLAQQAGFKATSSFKTLAAQLGVTGKVAQDQLTKGLEEAVTKMSSMNAVARNLAATVQTQLDTAMAGAIVKASGIGAATLKYATDLASVHPKASTLKNDVAGINSAMGKEETATRRVSQAVQTQATATGAAAVATARHAAAANQQATAAAKAAISVRGQATAATNGISPLGNLATKTTGAGSAASTMGGKVQTAGGHIQTAGGQANTATGKMQQLSTSTQRVGTVSGTSATSMNTLHTAIGGASSAAAGATGRMFQLSVSEGRVGTSAFQAAAAVRQLAAAIDSLHSKTINVTTVTSSVKAAAQGTLSADQGAYLVGERGPELVYMHGGERVVPANRTADTLAAITSAASAGNGGGMAEVHVHSHAYIDGKEVFSSVKTETLKYNTRNSGRRTGRLIPS